MVASVKQLETINATHTYEAQTLQSPRRISTAHRGNGLAKKGRKSAKATKDESLRETSYYLDEHETSGSREPDDLGSATPRSRDKSAQSLFGGHEDEGYL